MNQQDTITPQLAREIQDTLDTGQFPPDTDWQARRQVQEIPLPGIVNQLRPDWEYALDHPYNGLETVLTGGAETILDRTEHGQDVAFRLEPDHRDGETVVDARLHPAVRTARGECHAIDDETIARATITVRMTSPRTRALVDAYMVDNHPPGERQ